MGKHIRLRLKSMKKNDDGSFVLICEDSYSAAIEESDKKEAAAKVRLKSEK